MPPDKHFPGEPDQTEDLHLFRKSKNICFPRHPNVCGLDARPNTLRSGGEVGCRPVVWVLQPHDQEPAGHVNHDSSTLCGAN